MSRLNLARQDEGSDTMVNEKLSKDEQECIIFRMFHRRNEILSTLKPDDIYQLICEKAKSSAKKSKFLFRLIFRICTFISQPFLVSVFQD